MGAMYRLKAYFGMVPAEDMAEYADEPPVERYAGRRREYAGDRWGDAEYAGEREYAPEPREYAADRATSRVAESAAAEVRSTEVRERRRPGRRRPGRRALRRRLGPPPRPGAEPPGRGGAPAGGRLPTGP